MMREGGGTFAGFYWLSLDLLGPDFDTVDEGSLMDALTAAKGPRS